MGVAIWWVIVFSPKMVVGCQLFNQFRPGDTPEVELLWEASHVMSTKEIDLLGGLELRFTRFVYLFLYIYIDIFVYTVYPFVNCKYVYIYIFTYTYVYINDIYICITHTWKMEVEPTKHARRNGEPPQVFFFFENCLDNIQLKQPQGIWIRMDLGGLQVHRFCDPVQCSLLNLLKGCIKAYVNEYPRWSGGSNDEGRRDMEARNTMTPFFPLEFFGHGDILVQEGGMDHSVF